MRSKYKVSLLLSSVSILVSQMPVFAYIDWNWPMNQIPSNPKEIERAMTAYNSGEIDTAISALTNVKGMSPEDCRVRHILAELYREQKRFTEARNEYQELINFETKYMSNNSSKPGWMDPTQLKMEIADSYFEQGSISEAQQMYRDLAQQRPTWLEPRKMLGRCLEMQGDYEGARQHYKTLLDSGAAASAGDKNYLMSMVTNLDKAIEAKSQSAQGQQVATQPGGPAGVPANGMPANMHQPMGNNSFGSRSFSAAPGHAMPSSPYGTPGGIGSASPSHTVVATGPLAEATADITGKKYDAAIAKLKPIVQKSAGNAQAHYLMAIASVGKGDYKTAKEEYELTLKYAQDLKLQKLASSGLLKIQNKN